MGGHSKLTFIDIKHKNQYIFYPLLHRFDKTIKTNEQTNVKQFKKQKNVIGSITAGSENLQKCFVLLLKANMLNLECFIEMNIKNG